MDLQQTVQDLAEAWVAASTDTSFSRTQLQVYGSGGAQGEGAEEGTEPSTSGEGDFSSANPMSTPSSPPPHGLPSGDSLASSHSRKRKQSSPQPRREGSEPAAAPGLPDAAASTNKGNPHRQNVSKIQIKRKVNKGRCCFGIVFRYQGRRALVRSTPISHEPLPQTRLQ
ncbi:uncharacterized protein LOC115919710 isoform X1 [Strongylocentrotus purpuratus]|uniref:Uncharacterized protein n=1 Tax=Strongylocentrotus purpuratus TaxID=7668 RepID=A0A7M7N185_STRPU|nr:uncharacterized protein LOC115919710 isoform X1 [Strongylocentrotus purpuratus]